VELLAENFDPSTSWESTVGLDVPALPLVRHPLERTPGETTKIRTASAKSLTKPFSHRLSTVFDRFSGPAESRIVRRIKHPTVFAGRAAVKKRRKR